MKNQYLSWGVLFVSICMTIVFGVDVAWAQVQEGSLKPLVSLLDKASGGMTLWETIKSGGVIMIALGALSMVALTMIVYSFATINIRMLLPKDHSEDVLRRLEKGDLKGITHMCQFKQNATSNIVLAGLKKRTRGVAFTREAIESAARKEVVGLWQSISYLSDIATIAPLVGLLGTVLGMIQAFNVIAFQTAVVKPILLAGGVSKAMVTTAGGLIVAIPVMLFYSYFRGRVQNIVSAIEVYTNDVIRIFEEKGGRTNG